MNTKIFEYNSIGLEKQNICNTHMHSKLQLLPKWTNFHTLPKEYRNKDTTDTMSYTEKQPIVDKNNREYTKLQYELMNIKILSDYDVLRYQVEFPAGWSTKRIDGYHTNILDSKNRIRISYFYKNTPYDKDAFCNFCRRYNWDILPFDNYKSDASYEERKSKPWRLIITDCGQEIKLLRTYYPQTIEQYFDKDKILQPIAIDYLDSNYPEWKNIHAYWD